MMVGKQQITTRENTGAFKEAFGKQTVQQQGRKLLCSV